jgi:hypothetical protein
MLKSLGITVNQHYRVECFDPDGHLKWEESFDNLVVTAGLNYYLDIGLKGGSQDSTWFVGLKGTGTPVAGDTLASHGSWSEITPYTGNRPAWTGGSVSGGSVDNSASKAVFNINSSTTVYGAFMCSVDTGTSGTLLGVGDFAASRAVQSGDTLNVTVTCSMTSS